MFLIINNVGIMINADGNEKNWCKKEYVTKDLYGHLEILNVNMINQIPVRE